MSRVYILVKHAKNCQIEEIIKVFSANNYTQALKELYKYSGYGYNEDDEENEQCLFNFDNSFYILTRSLDLNDNERDHKRDYVPVYDFSDIRHNINVEIWDKIIEELPNTSTLNKLIEFDKQTKEYNGQVKKIRNEIDKRYTATNIRKEIKERLDIMNIQQPKFNSIEY